MSNSSFVVKIYIYRHSFPAFKLIFLADIKGKSVFSYFYLLLTSIIYYMKIRYHSPILYFTFLNGWIYHLIIAYNTDSFQLHGLPQ